MVSPSGAASERPLWLLEMCEERDPEGSSGGPGGHRVPNLSRQDVPGSHSYHCSPWYLPLK